MKKLYITLILLLVFSVTLFFRVQFISNKSHCLDDNHIYMLTTLSVWDKDGAFNHKLSPVITFTNPGDKFVSFYKRLQDKNGNNYYVSYPPLLFIISYPLLEIFGFENGKTVLQITNLLLHLISCFFIYLIVLYYFNKKYEKLFIPAVFAFAIYCFSPVVLYLHTDIYFPEMFSQFLLILSVYFTIKVLKETESYKNFHLLLFGLLIFCFVYTEWIGVFYVFSVCLILFYNRKRTGYIKIMKILIFGTSSAILLTLLQYSLIDGFKSMLRSFLIRFIDRSGYFAGRFNETADNIYNLNSYYIYLKNVFNSLWGVGFALIILILVWLIINKGKSKVGNILRNNLIVISVLPVLIYFFIFFNATMLHYHLVAKLMVPVSILSGLLIYKIFFPVNTLKRIGLSLFTALFIVTVFLSLMHYREYERLLISFTDKEKVEKTAAFISANARKDEVIFLNLRSQNPEPIIYLGFLTKRNMVYSASLIDSEVKLKTLPQKKAVYFEIDEKTGKFNYSRFEKPEGLAD